MERRIHDEQKREKAMSREIRLQKYMADYGVASRRKSEEMIQAGRVSVNGKVIRELGVKVTPGADEVSVDGTLVVPRRQFVYLMLNKPKGYVSTTNDPQGRSTVMELLPKLDERVYPVGRLDYATEGLLLFTNDGELTHAMTHPSRELNKTYQVRIKGKLTPEAIRKLTEGMQLEDHFTAPAQLTILSERGGESQVELVIHEGKYRQVRRMFEGCGYDVLRLVRTQVGPLRKDGVKRGCWRYLKKTEIKELRRAAGLDRKAPPERRKKHGKR